jgi:hypothetical protein
MRIRGVLLIVVSSMCAFAFPPTAAAQSLIHAWSQRFGDAIEHQFAASVATGGSGNIFVTGDFYSSVDFGGGELTSAGNTDVYVAGFDASGNHLWSKRFGDAGFQHTQSIATDGAGNVIVTGFFVGTMDFGGGPLTTAGVSDIFIAKFDAAGNHMWSQRFGDADHQHAYGVTTDGSGNVIVTGNSRGTVDFGGGGLTTAGIWDVFVARFDAAGNHLWSQLFGDSDNQFGSSVATDGSGNVMVTGYFLGTVDFGGGGLTSAGGNDIFIAKFDSAGSHLWSQRFGDASFQFAQSITADVSGNVIATGFIEGTADFGGGGLTSAGGSDVFVANFDAAGNHLWSQLFGDAAEQYGYGVTADGSGNVAVTGHFEGTVDFGGGGLTSAGFRDAFLARFDAAGNHLWSQRFGDASDQDATGITADGSDNVIMTGSFEGTVDFGGGGLVSAGGYDIYVAKLSPSGPVPTALQAFDATVRGGVIELTWRLSEIGRDARFFVLRSVGDRPFAPLHTVLVEYSGLGGAFADHTVKPGLEYRYRVDVSDADGRHTLFTTRQIAVPAAALTLGPAQPNPFNPETTVHYTVPNTSHVRLSVYDAHGKLVRTLVDGAVPTGARSATWNGRDNRGSEVSSGVYFVRLISGKEIRTGKIVLLK